MYHSTMHHLLELNSLLLWKLWSLSKSNDRLTNLNDQVIRPNDMSESALVSVRVFETLTNAILTGHLV